MRRVKVEILCDNPDHNEVEAVIEIPMRMLTGREKLVGVCAECETLIERLKIMYDAAPLADGMPKRGRTAKQANGTTPAEEMEEGRCPVCGRVVAKTYLGQHVRKDHGIGLREARRQAATH